MLDSKFPLPCVTCMHILLCMIIDIGTMTKTYGYNMETLDESIVRVEKELEHFKQLKKERDMLFCPLCQRELTLHKGSVGDGAMFGTGDIDPSVTCECGFSFESPVEYKNTKPMNGFTFAEHNINAKEIDLINKFRRE